MCIRDSVYDTNLESRTWRAYILRMPSLCGRSSDGHVIHRWSDNNGNHWAVSYTHLDVYKRQIWKSILQQTIFSVLRCAEMHIPSIAADLKSAARLATLSDVYKRQAFLSYQIVSSIFSG